MIESVGERVKELKEGDIVMPHFLGECGDCPNCKSKKSNLCHKYPLNFSGLLLDGTSRMSINGQKIYHHVSCSTLSEYIVLDENYVIKVDPRLPIEHVPFLCCAFTTGFGATWKDVNIEKGSTVAVLGLGGVGLGVSTFNRNNVYWSFLINYLIFYDYSYFAITGENSYTFCEFYHFNVVHWSVQLLLHMNFLKFHMWHLIFYDGGYFSIIREKISYIFCE